MHPVLKNTLAVVAGLVIGSIVNMALISVSGYIIPPPDGADVTTTEGLQASMHQFEPKHFIFPFLAHALGTFAGALVAAKLASNNKMAFALAIGVFFLLGGITGIFLLPSPLWYNIVDLVFAYIPFSYLAAKLVSKSEPRRFANV